VLALLRIPVRRDVVTGAGEYYQSAPIALPGLSGLQTAPLRIGTGHMAAQQSGGGIEEKRQVRGFRSVRAVCDQCSQRMSPNERMQYIQPVFLKGNRIVHAIDYAMQLCENAAADPAPRAFSPGRASGAAEIPNAGLRVPDQPVLLPCLNRKIHSYHCAVFIAFGCHPDPVTSQRNVLSTL